MQACSSIISAVSQLLIRCLYAMVNSIVAEQIYIMLELCH